MSSESILSVTPKEAIPWGCDTMLLLLLPHRCLLSEPSFPWALLCHSAPSSAGDKVEGEEEDGEVATGEAHGEGEADRDRGLKAWSGPTNGMGGATSSSSSCWLDLITVPLSRLSPST